MKPIFAFYWSATKLTEAHTPILRPGYTEGHFGYIRASIHNADEEMDMLLDSLSQPNSDGETLLNTITP